MGKRNCTCDGGTETPFQFLLLGGRADRPRSIYRYSIDTLLSYV